MRPDTSNYWKDGLFGDTYFGEINKNNRPHGRGLRIYNNGHITIGYFQNGFRSTGNYIDIDSDGEFRVGEFYFKDGLECRRGTLYRVDGSEKEYDDGASDGQV